MIKQPSAALSVASVAQPNPRPNTLNATTAAADDDEFSTFAVNLFRLPHYKFNSAAILGRAI